MRYQYQGRFYTSSELLALAKAMDLESALKILGLSKEDLKNKEKVKKAYRDKAVEAHPDRGGSDEEMKLINEAYEILTDEVGQSEKISDRAAREEEMLKKYDEASRQVAAILDKTFKPEPFIKHFEKIVGKSFSAEIKKDVKPHGVRYVINFSEPDALTAFDILIYTSTADVVNKSGSLGQGTMSFPLTVSTSVFHNNRKVKLSTRDWKITSDHANIIDPEELFPEAKLKKMMAGKEQKRAFSRRDMALAIDKRLGGSMDKDFARIPLGEDYRLVIYRTVFHKQAAWGVNGIYKGPRRIMTAVAVTFPENEELVEILVEIQEGAEGKQDQELIEYVEKTFKQKYAKFKAEMGIGEL